MTELRSMVEHLVSDASLEVPLAIAHRCMISRWEFVESLFAELFGVIEEKARFVASELGKVEAPQRLETYCFQWTQFISMALRIQKALYKVEMTWLHDQYEYDYVVPALLKIWLRTVIQQNKQWLLPLIVERMIILRENKGLHDTLLNPSILSLCHRGYRESHWTPKNDRNVVTVTPIYFELEELHLNQVRSFYARCSVEQVKQDACKNLDDVCDWIDYDFDFSQLYLPPESGCKIQTICIETILLSDKFDIRYLLRNDRYDELRKLYNLLEMVENGLQRYDTEFIAWVEMLMQQLKKQSQDPDIVVSCIIAMEIQCQKIICECFFNSAQFRQSVHNYFRQLANHTPFPLPLRVMILELFNAMVSDMSPTEMKIITMQRMIKFVSVYLDDMDQFIKSLACVCVDSEIVPSKEMMEAIEQEFDEMLGSTYRSRVKRFFCYLKQNEARNKAFAEYAQNERLPIHVEVSLLSSTSLTQERKVNSFQSCTAHTKAIEPLWDLLPFEVQRAIELFEKFLGGRESESSSSDSEEEKERRRIVWSAQMGSFEVTIKSQDNSDGRRVTTLLSTSQLYVLLLLSDQGDSTGTTMTIQMMQERTGLAFEVLREAIEPLLASRIPFLQSSPGPLSPASVLAIVSGPALRHFLDSNELVDYRYRSLLRDRASSQQNQNRVAQCTRELMDSVLTRIIKSRRAVALQIWLETAQQMLSSICKSEIDTAQLRERLEILDDRGYVRQDNENQDLWHYVP